MYTCESCKAFFRRNALRLKVVSNMIKFFYEKLKSYNQEFTCPFEDNCNIDCITRRFCQKCRLSKCLEIGMKKEWIMTENEKNIKKKKRIDANRWCMNHMKHCITCNDFPIDNKNILMQIFQVKMALKTKQNLKPWSNQTQDMLIRIKSKMQWW